MFRRAQIGDLPKLAELSHQLGYQIDEKALEQNLETYGESVFVLEIDGGVIGYLAYHILPQFHSSEKHMRIISLIVDQAHRGIGIGKKFIKEAERIAKDKGCSIVELTSASHRMKSHSFYTNQGYKADGEKIYFRKKLLS